MGRVVYFDCPSGAAGDMIMAALVDAGVPFEGLRAELRTLPLQGWDLVRREVKKGAFRATKIDVDVDRAAHRHDRSLADILAILDASPLSPAVKERAGRIFARLADAEARVHGTSRDTVHFHEVGAVDAIVDVTGGVLGLAMLGAEAVYVSALPLGTGFVEAAHGRIPLPAPGTAERVLAVMGTADPYTPADHLAELEAAGATVLRYEGAEHGFVHDPARPAHRADHAADAWRRATAWLSGP